MKKCIKFGSLSLFFIILLIPCVHAQSLNVTILSPENITYNVTGTPGGVIDLNWTVNSTIIEYCDYSLNGGSNQSLNNTEGNYTEFNFTLFGDLTDVADITNNDTHFYIVDPVEAEIYEYLFNGTHTGFTFDTAASGNALPFGITNNGTYFYITDVTDDLVYEYLFNGTYTGFNFSTAGTLTDIRGITNNGTHFYIVDSTGDEVYEYLFNGTYTGFSFDTAGVGNANPIAITNDNNYFWVTDINDNLVYKYFFNGTYTGFTFDTSVLEEHEYGITNNGTYFYITDSRDSEEAVYEYTMKVFFNSSITAIFGSNNVTVSCTGSFGSSTVFFSYSCESVCSSTCVGNQICGGDSLNYIITCRRLGYDLYQWDWSNKTLCKFGCFDGNCTYPNTTQKSNCVENDTICQGKRAVGCSYFTNANVWKWNNSNSTDCSFGCSDGKCITGFSVCMSGNSVCDGNTVRFCDDDNNDGYLEFSKVNVTFCKGGHCVENGTSLTASCSNQSFGQIQSFWSFMEQQGRIISFIFNTYALKVALSFLAIMAVIWIMGVSLKLDWKIVLFSCSAISIILVVFRIMPVLMSIILIFISFYLINKFGGGDDS